MYNNSFMNPYNNNMYGNGSYNQPLPNMNSFTHQRKQEVETVNGENGARMYALAPNSSVLLLDETAPIIWLKVSDSAGYPTLTPYDISPHQTAELSQTNNIDLLEQRITKLEALVNEKFNESNVESTKTNKQFVTIGDKS